MLFLDVEFDQSVVHCHSSPSDDEKYENLTDRLLYILLLDQSGPIKVAEVPERRSQLPALLRRF